MLDDSPRHGEITRYPKAFNFDISGVAKTFAAGLLCHIHEAFGRSARDFSGRALRQCLATWWQLLWPGPCLNAQRPSVSVNIWDLAWLTISYYIYICIHRVIENDIVGTSTINWDIKAVWLVNLQNLHGSVWKWGVPPNGYFDGENGDKMINHQFFWDRFFGDRIFRQPHIKNWWNNIMHHHNVSPIEQESRIK
jgi:hypothetical protein